MTVISITGLCVFIKGPEHMSSRRGQKEQLEELLPSVSRSPHAILN